MDYIATETKQVSMRCNRSVKMETFGGGGGLSTGGSRERPVSISPSQYAAKLDPTQSCKLPCHGKRENENLHGPLLGGIEM